MALHAALFTWKADSWRGRFIGAGQRVRSGPIVVASSYPAGGPKKGVRKKRGGRLVAKKRGLSGPPRILTKSDFLGWGNAVPSYPLWAREQGFEGIVKAEITFAKDRVIDVEIEQSSGHLTLDQAVLNTLWNWEIPSQVKTQGHWKNKQTFEFRLHSPAG